MAGMSDTDIWGAAPSQPSGMSDADIWGSPPEPSTVQDIGRGAESGIAKTLGYIADPTEPIRQMAAPILSDATRLAGAAYTGLGGELSPEQAEFMTNPWPQSKISSTIQSAIDENPYMRPQTGYGRAAETAVIAAPYVMGGEEGLIPQVARTAGVGAGSEGAKTIAQEYGAGEKGQQLASIAGGVAGYGAPKVAGDIGQAATDSLSASRAANAAAKQAAQNAPFLNQKANNINYVEGLNANAENLKQTYGDIYDKAAEISQGVTRNEPVIQKTLGTLLDDLKDDPAHQGEQGTSQAYRDLSAVNDSFDEHGNIPLDSITLLQRRVNDLYSPDMSAARGKIYNTLNTQLKGAAQRAAQDNPEWGTMMGSANKLFANYKDTYANDPKTDSIWSLDDKKNYEDAKATNADPYGAGMNTATRDKLYNLPSNVKNLAQYEATLRKLPPEMHDQFTKDVVAAQSEDAPNVAGRIYAAYKAAKGNPYYMVQTAKNIYSALSKNNAAEINPSVADMAPHVNDAIDYYGKLSNEAYQFYKQRAGGANFSMTGQKALPAPSTLALPAPETPMQSGWPGTTATTQPMTPAARDTAIATRQANPSAGISSVESQPPVAANDPRAPRAQSGTWKNNIMRENANRPISTTSGTEYTPPSQGPGGQALEALAKGQSPDVDAEFNKKFPGMKRGGAIPTPAQISTINKIAKKTRAGRAA